MIERLAVSPTAPGLVNKLRRMLFRWHCAAHYRRRRRDLARARDMARWGNDATSDLMRRQEAARSQS